MVFSAVGARLAYNSSIGHIGDHGRACAHQQRAPAHFACAGISEKQEGAAGQLSSRILGLAVPTARAGDAALQTDEDSSKVRPFLPNIDPQFSLERLLVNRTICKTDAPAPGEVAEPRVLGRRARGATCILYRRARVGPTGPAPAVCRPWKPLIGVGRSRSRLSAPDYGVPGPSLAGWFDMVSGTTSVKAPGQRRSISSMIASSAIVTACW